MKTISKLIVKAIFFLIFMLTAISCNSQTLTNIVRYRGVELKLPSTWNYEGQEREEDFMYQISCWEKGGANCFALIWFETEMNAEEYLNSIKESLKKEAIYKKAVFSQNRKGTFQNIETLYSTFESEFMEYKYSGKSIVFNNNNKTFAIIHQGDGTFYNSHLDEKIIASLKIGFLSNTSLSSTSIPNGWTLYEIGDIGQISIPPTLELRGDNSRSKLIQKVMNDYYAVHLDIETKRDIVFQPSGRDADPENTSVYARVIINHDKGQKGDYLKWNFNLTPSERKELDNYFKQKLLDSFSKANSMTSMKLVNRSPIDVGKINGLSYIKESYTRQIGNRPIVKVDTYYFFNSDEKVDITISYRLSESTIWASDLAKIANTFSFKTKKH